MDERRYFEYREPRVYSKFWRPSLNDTGNMKPGVSQDRILEFWLATRLCAAPATSSFTSVTPPVVKPAKFCARYFVPLRRGDHSNLPVSMNWGGLFSSAGELRSSRQSFQSLQPRFVSVG